jgi:hypothetical protein
MSGWCSASIPDQRIEMEKNMMTIDDVLNSYPSLRGDAEYVDSDALSDLKEWTEIARATLARTAETLNAVELQLDAAQMDRTAPLEVQVKALRDQRDLFRKHAEERAAELAHFVSQRDAEVDQLQVGFMRQRAMARSASDDAAALATENLLQERLVAKLVAKVKRLEATLAGAGKAKKRPSTKTKTDHGRWKEIKKP